MRLSDMRRKRLKLGEGGDLKGGHRVAIDSDFGGGAVSAVKAFQKTLLLRRCAN